MSANSKTKYNYMQHVLQQINKHFIALPKQDVERNNKILEQVIDQLTKKMKRYNTLFRTSFTEFYHGGSFYDGLKVGKPEEFDLVFLCTLPDEMGPDVIVSDIPGYVKIRLREYEDFMETPEAYKWRELDKLVDRKYYLDATKVSEWMQKILQKAFNRFPECTDGSRIFNTPYGRFMGKIHKEGPAFTLKLSGKVGRSVVSLAIDLVPSFIFSEDNWPEPPFYGNPIEELPNFLVVPKHPHGNGNFARYWRLSFQSQEDELIKGLENLKPTIRLLKKLQEKLGKEIVTSYIIKTIFLWEVQRKDEEFWENSLSYLFMIMLKKYKSYLRRDNIPYYWYKEDDLLPDNGVGIQDLANRLQHIINDIENNPNNPYVVAKHLLKPNEFAILINQYYD